MKKKIYIAFGLLLSYMLAACDDWLDVRSEVEEKEADLFETYEGFRSALSGCYLAMTERNVYGEKMTMTDMESLACLWYGSQTYGETIYNLTRHNYESEVVQKSLKNMYLGLFNVVTQANVIIKHLQNQGNVIPTEEMRAVIEGEAYALRAYCQFDLLRMFGQMPQGGTQSVMLPYSNTTQLSEMPSYYSFTDYVGKLKADLDKAELLLRDNDPACHYSFDNIYMKLENLAGTVTDDFFTNREFRLNYWAVKGLKARLALYLGEKEEAYALAMEIINAKDENGNVKFPLSGTVDLAADKNFFGLPSEALFMLSQYDLKDYANRLLVGGAGAENTSFIPGERYVIFKTMFDELFAGALTSSDNRYLYQWNKTLKNNHGEPVCAIKKYWYADDADATYLATKHRVIPMLRMSEIYLIAVETAPSLDESNELFAAYQRSHNVLLLEDAFVTSEDLNAKLLDEYRRELFAEGQMFFTYKRVNSSKMLWGTGTVNEEVYVLPLPNTEYNPN